MNRHLILRLFTFMVILSLLLGATGAISMDVKAASTISFSAEELMARPTNTSITINVVPDESVSIYYEYGTSPGLYTHQTTTATAPAGEPYNVVISGLSPDTQYYYRMQYQKPADVWVARSEHSFHTQRAAGQAFTFTVVADSHMSGGGGTVSLYQQTLANIAAEKPDFHFDLGDSFWTDGVTNSTTANQRYLAQRQWMSAVSNSAATFVAPGNHENVEGWNFDDTNSLALLSLNAQKRYYPNPIPDSFYSGNPDTSLSAINGDHLREDYFAWTWGDTLFVVIDPYQYTLTKPYSGTAGGELDDESPVSLDNWDWTLGLNQFNWLKTTLENSTAKYKFVFAHHMVGGLPAYYYVRGGAEAANLYEWGGYNSNGSTWGFDAERPGWGTVPIHQLLVANHVSAFFYGHDHEYAYQKRDGVVYQLVPSPAMTGFGFGLYNESDPYTERVLANSGHLLVTVNSSQATVDYIATSGATVNYSYPILPESSAATYDLSLAVDPVGGGTTNPGAGVHTYNESEVVTVTAAPAAGYAFNNWSGSCSGSGACQVTMDAAKSVTAHFSSTSADGITYLGSLGSATSKTSGTSLVVTTSAAAASGDDMIVGVVTDPNSSLVVSVADPAGNTYNQVGYVVNSGSIRTYIFAAYNVNPLPSGSSITITASPAVTARAAVVALFSGLADSDVFDQMQTGYGTSTAPSSGATPTTTQADELLVGVVGTEGPDGDTAGAWDGSFLAGPRLGTTGSTADTNLTVSLGYRIVSDTGAYTASKTGITSRDWGAMIATFRAGSSLPGPRITITGTPLSAFTSLPGSPSTVQNYTVSGSDLTGAITITAPGDFQVSLSSGSGFTASLALSPSGGLVPATPIYVRFNRATEGTSTGNIVHTSTGAATRNVAVSGTAAPLSPVSFNIMLGRPKDTSITANIIPDYDVEFYIQYGSSSGTFPTQTATYNATASNPIEFVISGLSANTRYYYRIVYRRTGITEWNYGAQHSFVTQKPAGSPFVFTVTSDNHLGQYGGVTADELALWQVTLQNILGENPDFHIDTGDTFPMDPSPLGTGMTDAETKTAYYYDRPYLAAITDSIPYFQVLGNHENEEGWNFDDVFASPDVSLALGGMKYRKLYYPNPVPDSFYSGNTDTSYGVIGGDTNQEDYWAWTWGDALFVSIDPFHYSLVYPAEGDTYGGEGQDNEIQGTRWDWSMGIQQYQWFKSVLENSQARYKFVFTHQVDGGATVYGRGGQSAAPYFEWGGKNWDGTWGFDLHRPAADGWSLPIHDLMVKNGVKIFFHGHDHDYARELVDGIVYLECPKPDDAGYAWEPYSYGHNENLYPNNIVELQNSGYFRVSVSPAEAKVEYVRSYLPGDGTNGVVADSVTVPGTTPASYRLLVNKTGTGSGTVTSSPAGIDCGSTCSAAFSSGANVVLTATPASGSTFTGWGGDCSGTGNCSLSMNAAHVVMANFSITGTTYSLTVNAGSNGTISTPAGTTTRNAGEVVTITASPNSGYHFVNWTGSLSMLAHTTGASTTVAMYGNYTITANFAANTSTSYTLTTRATSGGTVTVPSSSPASFTSGTVASLTASPNSGYHFVNWTGLINTVANPKSASTTVVMNGSYVIQANFAPDSGIFYSLSAGNDGHGTVTLSPSGGSYASGTSVILIPVANAGYQFSSWSGTNAAEIVNSALGYTLLMNGDKTVQANFIPAAYTLAVNRSGAGSGTITSLPPGIDCGGTCSTSFSYNTSVTLTAAAADDSTFAGWSGTCTGSLITCTLLMDSARSVTAAFIPETETPHAISLASGWNLVSFNVHPSSTAVADVLATIAGSYSLVFAWDNSVGSGQWLKYAPTGPVYANTLTSLDEQMGFWIRMTAPGTLTVSGSAPSDDIALVNGWNLAGYPSRTTLSLPEALTGHGVSDLLLVYAYHAGDSDLWKVFDSNAPAWSNDLNELSPGWGYWVRLGGAHTWEVTY